MAVDSIRVTRSVVLPLAEVELQYSRSSGPGGQHAQKSETRAVAVFDVAASTALTERQKQRVIARVGPVLRAVAQDERSRTRNTELALERLVAQLRDALHVERTAGQDEAVRGGTRTAARAEEAARGHETPPPRARLGSDSPQFRVRRASCWPSDARPNHTNKEWSTPLRSRR